MSGRSRYGRGVALAAVAALGIGGLAACQPLTPLNSVSVSTATDGSDADPGDGVCEVTVGAGDCSLRAAIDEANVDDAIIYVSVPPGTYELTDGGAEDANATGDLDIDPASGHLTFLAPRGTVVDAAGAGAAIDARGGLTYLNGISATGSSGPGHIARAGADLWVSGGSPHGNAGPAFVYEAGSNGQIRNTTVSANGGGIDNAGSVTVGLSTITGNAGAGIAGAGTTTVTGSIVANQTGGPDCTAAITSTGWNAFGEAGCGLGADDTLNPSLVLTPELVDGVPGFVPGASSPDVRDVIPNGSGPCQPGLSSLDQHATARPVGAACDKGALETESPTTALVVDTAADGSDAAPGDGVCDDGTGACTLRAAIQEANTQSGGAVEVINVAPGINPVLAPNGPLTIAGGLVIDGGGATITASIPSHVFVVEHLDTTFRNLTVTGALTGTIIGTAGTDAGRSVTLDHVAITLADWGPSNSGVYVEGAALTIVDSQILAAGGQAVLAPVADLVIERSSIQGKDAVVSENDVAERVVVRDSTVRGGDLDLYLIDIGESVLIERSTITNSYYGSSVSAPEVIVRASTFAGGSGGPGFSGSSSLEITASTFATVGSYAGVFLSGATVTVRGTVVSGSYTTTACWISPSSTFVSGGYNSSSDTSCGFTGTGDVQGVVSSFGPLADNGGPTQTRLPTAGSPLIGAIPTGTPGLCDGSSATIDQRGVARPQGAACDVGAVEQ